MVLARPGSKNQNICGKQAYSNSLSRVAPQRNVISVQEVGRSERNNNEHNDIPKKDSAYLLTTTEPQKNVTDINQN